MGGETFDDGGSGTYYGVGYSIEIKGNFLGGEELSGVIYYKYSLFGVLVSEEIENSIAGVKGFRKRLMQPSIVSQLGTPLFESFITARGAHNWELWLLLYYLLLCSVNSRRVYYAWIFV